MNIMLFLVVGSLLCDPCSRMASPLRTGPGTCKIKNGEIISYENIRNFGRCIEIKGDINITNNSFHGMHPRELEVFQNVTSITGNLLVEGNHPDFKNLSYFRQLRFIQGDEFQCSLSIESTSLESIELSSLQEIKGNCISILNNNNLCYVNTINWDSLFDVQEERSIKGNRESEHCIADGYVCDKQCDESGCWGPGPYNCVHCRNGKQSNICIEKYGTTTTIYTDNDVRKCAEPCQWSSFPWIANIVMAIINCILFLLLFLYSCSLLKTCKKSDGSLPEHCMPLNAPKSKVSHTQESPKQSPARKRPSK